MNDEVIKAYNEGYNQGKSVTERNFTTAMCVMSDKITELENKHWEECRQIALYDDELRRAKKLLSKWVEDVDEALKTVAES